MSYILCIGERHPFLVASDEESQRGLFLAIEQNAGINRIAAQALLDDGKMLVADDLVVVRADVWPGRFSAEGLPKS